MQTRKRAKSVSFGKKKEEKSEKEEIKKVSEETPVEESKKFSEKAEVVERRTVPEKPQSDELSSTLPKEEVKEKESETPAHDVATSKDDFVADDSPTESFETSHESKPKEDSVSSEEPVSSEDAQPEETEKPESTELSQPLETSPQATPPPVQPPSQEGEELSSTLPPSAFTIQSNEQEFTAKPEEGKKRFGIYFFVVAFLAFILGLGAMAAVSYFGLINLSVPKFSMPGNISVPGLSKPTPTPLPQPTAAPTTVQVDLKAYSISVLNGSGVTGQAGKVKDSLTTDGFNVTSTGNADNSNYTKTEIAAKKSVSQAYLTKLEAEIGKTLDVDSTVAALQDSSTTDVTVTLGSQTAQ